MIVQSRLPIVDLGGRQVQHRDAFPATFASIVIPALFERMAEDRCAGEALALFALASRIDANPRVELTPAEAETIKGRVFKMGAYNHLVVARIHQILDDAALAASGLLGEAAVLFPLRHIEEV